MVTIQLYPNAQQFDADGVSFSLSAADFKNQKVISIQKHSDQHILVYAAVRATVSANDAAAVNATFGIQII